ncbi:uncharacterized protein LOC143572469 [Bidens hawaiensis]|uniref:uncharacterized protein LOC143572469 n=1 Tax=Bidens hawaiensis TaxID=980011 RepID=UPI004048EEAE
MDPITENDIQQIKDELASKYSNLPYGFVNLIEKAVSQIEQQNKFSQPMVWIGIYIAVASFFCILPIVADLIHGFKNKKLWFPCKYFTLNAASLTVIAIAMKLPMDLTDSMPHAVDQAAKLGSMAFMCTMMANLLPSLATMDSKELLTNTIALEVLVITLVVNVFIQTETGEVPNYEAPYYHIVIFNTWKVAIGYVAMLLALLMIHACSALMIPKAKQILESKYKACQEIALKDLELQQPTVKKLKQHVKNHWIMAGTGSPQFMTVSSATTSAAGVICVASTFIHVNVMIYTIPTMNNCGSDYKRSVSVIFLIQFTGVILGTVAPLSRCFTSLSFEMSIKWIWNHIRVFKVESYYTQKLSEWKRSSIPLTFSSRKYKIVIQNLKVLILGFCIGIQKMVVVACKMIALIPNLFVIGILCCFHSWNWLNNVLVERPSQVQHNRDLSLYVLQLQDDMELAMTTLKSISKSVNHVIEKAEKHKPNYLMELLEEYSGFEGVGKYDMHQASPLTKEKYVDCWSLPVVTLTAVAMSLPNIQKEIVDRLLMSVSEGLTYVTHIVEALNAAEEYVSIQKAATMLWLEVEVYHKWLGYKLLNPHLQVNATKEIIQWFSDTAKKMVTEVESKNMKGSDDNTMYMSASANSMYRITQTILVSYHAEIDQISQEELFMQLSSMISNILAACLTNLPRVIAMKCHTSVIEKREAGVHTAARLLGETMQIVNSLQDRVLPMLNPDELMLIDKWRDCFLHLSS